MVCRRRYLLGFDDDDDEDDDDDLMEAEGRLSGRRS